MENRIGKGDQTQKLVRRPVTFPSMKRNIYNYELESRKCREIRSKMIDKRGEIE